MTHLIYLQSDSGLGHFRQSCQEETKPKYIKKRKKKRKKGSWEPALMQDPKSWTKDTQEDAVENQDTSWCNLKTLKIYYPWLWIFYFAEELLRRHWGGLLSPALGPTSPFPTEVAGRWGCTEDTARRCKAVRDCFCPTLKFLKTLKNWSWRSYWMWCADFSVLNLLLQKSIQYGWLKQMKKQRKHDSETDTAFKLKLFYFILFYFLFCFVLL